MPKPKRIVSFYSPEYRPKLKVKLALHALEEACYWLDDAEAVKAVERIMRKIAEGVK